MRSAPRLGWLGRDAPQAQVKRLRDERVGFDTQLAGIEKTLKAKEHDYEELLLLSHDASAPHLLGLECRGGRAGDVERACWMRMGVHVVR